MKRENIPTGAPRPVGEQLADLGYEIRTKGLPKLMARRDGVTYLVFVESLFGQGLTEKQQSTINLLDQKEIEVLVVKLNVKPD